MSEELKQKSLINFMNPWIHTENHPNNRTPSEKISLPVLTALGRRLVAAGANASGLERVGTRFVFIEI